jgi:SAM-dependent methyltransferase
MILKNTKYYHDEEHHNLISPRVIVPYLIKAINPQNIIDVGCGIGTFLRVFIDNGIVDVYGLDGEWTDKMLLSKNLDLTKFQEVDLENRIFLNRRFQLAISLEVAEHLNESSADIFVENIIGLSDIIVFSAAYPTQGGQNHLNEQWPSYWNEKFTKHGYKFYDVLRPLFWNNLDVQIWYKQNIFLIIKEGCEKDIVENFIKMNNTVMDIIHPSIYDYYYNRNIEFEKLINQNNKLIKGRESFFLYIKLITKWILRKINIYTK